MSTDIKDIETNDDASMNDGEDEYTYKPRNRASRNEKKKIKEFTEEKTIVKEKKPCRAKKPLIIIFSLILILLLGAFVSLAVYSKTLPKDVIAGNVMIANHDCGGKNVTEAQDLVNELFDQNTLINVKCKDKEANILVSDVGISKDEITTVQNALAIGKSGNIFKDVYEIAKLIFSEEEIPLVLKCDQDALAKKLFEFGTTINGVSTETKFEYDDDSMTIIPGTAGQDYDTTIAQKEVLTAVSNGILSSIDVTLNYAEPAKLDANEVYENITKPCENAKFEREENGNIKIIPHTVGVDVDKNDLANAIEKVNNGEKVTIPAKITLPELTTEIIEKNLFKSVIGSFSSDFSSSSENRAFNVTRAANSINGKILMPGETFSYNEAIGNPNLENGYKKAPVFENGKHTEGVGGGVCQVSSTLYNAVLLADLNVTSRTNHSLTVGYVPKGQDATVSYGHLDFKFKNNTDYPIRINSVVQGRRLTVSIIGAPYSPKKTVKIDSKIIETIEPKEVVTEDANMPKGTRKVTEKGSRGYVVETYKTVYIDGKEESSKKITTSKYKASDTQVTVGTKVVENEQPKPVEPPKEVPTDIKEETTPANTNEVGENGQKIYNE